MTYNDLLEVAKELYQKLKEADVAYLVTQHGREKITDVEVVQIKMIKPSLPRFRITTESGAVLLLTPSQFLRKKYIIIKDGKEYKMMGE